MADLKKVTCPHCGREMEIPQELEAYSCLYCGERTEIVKKPVESASMEAFEAARGDLKPRLPKTVTDYSESYKKITRSEFFKTFEAYENGTRSLFREMDDCALLHPEGLEAASRVLAGDLLDGLDAEMAADKRWKHKGSRNTMIFENKVILAIFLTSTVRKLGLSCAEEFRTELHSQWMQRYPKENWMPGDYDEMASGFRKRKWCFITTAVCSHEGKPDDCAELTAFRAFRDGWLTEHGGEALIAEYYEKAPGIVSCIELCDDPEERYAELRSRWLEPCYLALRENRFTDCRDSYIDMVRTMEHRYFS